MKNVFVIITVVILSSCASLGPPKVNLMEVSDDPMYGYTPDNPIKVGGYKHVGPKNEYIYLNQIAGPNGEPIEYKRLGPCCPFKTRNNDYGNWVGKPTGLLDVFLVRYEGISEPVKIFINGYDYETPKVIKGFKVLAH